MAEVHPYREHNHDIQDYLQRYYQVPKPPKIIYLYVEKVIENKIYLFLNIFIWIT